MFFKHIDCLKRCDNSIIIQSPSSFFQTCVSFFLFEHKGGRTPNEKRSAAQRRV